MAGSTRLTASGVAGTSGKPVRVYSFSVRSGASGPGVLTFHNGTANTATEDDGFTGTADSVTSKNYGSQGKYFPAGLYVNMDSDVSYIDLDYEHPVVA